METYKWNLENLEFDEAVDVTSLDHRTAWDQGALTVVKKIFQRI